MTPLEEIKRAVRHALAPLAVYAVTAGYVPESLAGPVTEAVVAVVAYTAVMVWSKMRDRLA